MTKEEMLENIKKLNAQLEDVREKFNPLLESSTEENDVYQRLSAADWYLDGLQRGLKHYEDWLNERD